MPVRPVRVRWSAYYKKAQQRYDGLRVVTYPKKGFNFSGINNFGRKYATGEYLLLLNNDVEVRNDNARHKHQAESLSGARIEELSSSEDCLCARNLHLIFNFCKYRNFFSSKCSFFCNFAKFYRIQ